MTKKYYLNPDIIAFPELWVAIQQHGLKGPACGSNFREWQTPQVQAAAKARLKTVDQRIRKGKKLEAKGGPNPYGIGYCKYLDKKNKARVDCMAKFISCCYTIPGPRDLDTLFDTVLQCDKDILFRGNKIYGIDTCMWAPASLNRYAVDPSTPDKPLGVTALANGMYRSRTEYTFEKLEEDDRGGKEYKRSFTTLEQALEHYHYSRILCCVLQCTKHQMIPYQSNLLVGNTYAVAAEQCSRWIKAEHTAAGILERLNKPLQEWEDIVAQSLWGLSEEDNAVAHYRDRVMGLLPDTSEVFEKFAPPSEINFSKKQGVNNLMWASSYYDPASTDLRYQERESLRISLGILTDEEEAKQREEDNLLSYYNNPDCTENPFC